MTKTLFSALMKISGLSLKEAATFLNVRPDTINSWSSGRNPAKEAVLVELADLINLQERAAEAAFDVWQEQNCPEIIEFGYCTDDHEAQGLGWPCASAHSIIAARLYEMVAGEAVIDMKPRASTIGLAIAEDVRL